MPSPSLVLIVASLVTASARRGRRALQQTDGAEDDAPQRAPTRKEASDSGASLDVAMHMPWLPTHRTQCDGGRACGPGEGNLKGYKMWGQPYIHREAWVQAKSRRPPHPPDPTTHYAGLVQVARRVARDRLVVMAAADWDFRQIVLNWYHHLRAVDMTNALVLSMDAELHAHLRMRGVPSADNTDNVQAWNTTCLQRHVQRVRMERQLALAALVGAGFDVLHTDATVVFVRNVLPMMRSVELADVDLIVQREGGPAGAVRKLGTAVNAGFTLVRARNPDRVRTFLSDAVRRGLVEFYNRWNNVVDQMGWSFLVADTAKPTAGLTSQLANETTVVTLGRYDLRLAWLPYESFPRIGAWDELRRTAAIYHLTADGSLGPQYAQPWGVVPFRGHRQRLDRYDDEDFAEHAKVMRMIGLWHPGDTKDKR